jgi:hypothetical protein
MVCNIHPKIQTGGQYLKRPKPGKVEEICQKYGKCYEIINERGKGSLKTNVGRVQSRFYFGNSAQPTLRASGASSWRRAPDLRRRALCRPEMAH